MQADKNDADNDYVDGAVIAIGKTKKSDKLKIKTFFAYFVKLFLKNLASLNSQNQ